MACTICGAVKTVRSHIIPKAFTLEVRDGAPHAMLTSRHHPGAKPLQGGVFTDLMLCAEHENATASADKYAIEFVRRVAAAWLDRTAPTALIIDNPQPHLLRSFALLTIWREIHSSRVRSLSLGPYEDVVRRHVFEGADAPDWAVIVQRTNFRLPSRGAIDFNLHPYRARFADRACWMLTVAGVCFIVVYDRLGLPAIFSSWRGDQHNPIQVTVSDPIPFTEVGALKSILAGMAAKKR